MENQYQLNTEWDDESYAGYFSDESESYNYDDEFSLGGLIKSGVNAVGGILGNPIGTAVKTASNVGRILGVNATPASTSGIPSKSNLTGRITTAGGKQVPVQLSESVAHKQDIQILQGAIQKINTEIKKVADTTTNNGLALTKLTQEVKRVDEKHTMATRKQNELIAKLGSGADSYAKDIKELKSQGMMNMMLPLLIPPKIESIKFADIPVTTERDKTIRGDGATSYGVSEAKTTDNSILFLLMAMSGSGGSGGSGSSGAFGFGDNPLMLILLLKAIGGGSGGGLF